MSDEDLDQLTEHIDAALNERLGKLTIAVVVMAVGFVGGAVALGIQWGVLSSEVSHNGIDDVKHHGDSDLHMKAADKYATFVSRQEWVQIQGARDVALNDLKAAILRLESKIDTKL